MTTQFMAGCGDHIDGNASSSAGDSCFGGKGFDFQTNCDLTNDLGRQSGDSGGKCS